MQVSLMCKCILHIKADSTHLVADSSFSVYMLSCVAACLRCCLAASPFGCMCVVLLGHAVWLLQCFQSAPAEKKLSLQHEAYSKIG